MRRSHHIVAALTALLALLFVALDLAGAVWVGTVLGTRVFSAVAIAGHDPAVVLLVMIGVSMLLMKLVSSFAAASLWHEGRRGAVIAAAAVGLSGLAYGWTAGMVALSEAAGLQVLSVNGAVLFAAIGLLIGLMSGILPFVAVALFAVRPTPSDVCEQPAAAPAVTVLRQIGAAGQFLAACTRRQLGANISARNLFEAYEAWCERSGLTPLAYAPFGKAVSSLGLAKHKSKGCILYHDIALMPVTQGFSTGREAGREANSLPRSGKKRPESDRTALQAA